MERIIPLMNSKLLMAIAIAILLSACGQREVGNAHDESFVGTHRMTQTSKVPNWIVARRQILALNPLVGGKTVESLRVLVNGFPAFAGFADANREYVLDLYIDGLIRMQPAYGTNSVIHEIEAMKSTGSIRKSQEVDGSDVYDYKRSYDNFIEYAAMGGIWSPPWPEEPPSNSQPPPPK
jgi:hypothetical protein